MLGSLQEALQGTGGVETSVMSTHNGWHFHCHSMARDKITNMSRISSTSVGGVVS